MTTRSYQCLPVQASRSPRFSQNRVVNNLCADDAAFPDSLLSMLFFPGPCFVNLSLAPQPCATGEGNRRDRRRAVNG